MPVQQACFEVGYQPLTSRCQLFSCPGLAADSPNMRPGRVRVSLTGQVALFSLVPIVVLGVALAWVLRGQIVDRTLADASQSASLVARLGVQPRISEGELEHGLSANGVKALDEQLSARSATHDLARIKIWNNKGLIVYSDDHSLIGQRPGESDDLQSALRGQPDAATVVNPSSHSETTSEVGLGRLVEVYVPLRFDPSEPPAGAFEIYLSYAPIAAAIGKDERTIALLVALGLALLWAILFRIVASASRRLSHQAEENYRLARFDQLTGLPNRTLFAEQLAEVLDQERAAGDDVAVLLLDLEGFKQINDTLGHGAGDMVLIEVGRRLRASLGDTLAIARLGNDEYALLQPHSEGQAGALATAARVRSTMEEPLALEGAAVNVEASVGIALAPDHASDAETLLRRADMALAHARSYHGVVEVYSAEHDHFDTARLKLLGQVRPALERKEFVLFYQPKIDLTHGHVTGVEALLRWRHPQRGMLAPLEFMPLIEQTALIGSVTKYVIDQALIQLAEWRAAGLEFGMSVNLSAFNLHDPSLPGHVESLLKAHATPAGALTVEVTESAAMADIDKALGVLHALRRMGVGISIDDFGSGHASIAYLTRLPATELKIDRSLITYICESPRDEAIARTTIDLARHLDLSVVAEGIETVEVAERLVAIGCDVGQGYFISRPLPAEELVAWLRGRLAGETGRRAAQDPRTVAE
ncbi:MAG TPA: bifunctional diguanylate cyclase/phosphodiesterase [Solirubrobacteraceae bacterium]|nr:bifunctional diguanylate cyclase/phosphodiesterase [Solirubrobacteraceae bacterium]